MQTVRLKVRPLAIDDVTADRGVLKQLSVVPELLYETEILVVNGLEFASQRLTEACPVLALGRNFESTGHLVHRRQAESEDALLESRRVEDVEARNELGNEIDVVVPAYPREPRHLVVDQADVRRVDILARISRARVCRAGLFSASQPKLFDRVEPHFGIEMAHAEDIRVDALPTMRSYRPHRRIQFAVVIEARNHRRQMKVHRNAGGGQLRCRVQPVRDGRRTALDRARLGLVDREDRELHEHETPAVQFDKQIHVPQDEGRLGEDDDGQLTAKHDFEKLPRRSNLLLQQLVRIHNRADVDDLLSGHRIEVLFDARQQIRGWEQLLHEIRRLPVKTIRTPQRTAGVRLNVILPLV